MGFWFGFSKKVAPKTWLNWSRSGPSITRRLGYGMRVNFNPRYGTSVRFSRRLGQGTGCLYLVLVLAMAAWLLTQVHW
jgi:hypothetical protein